MGKPLFTPEELAEMAAFDAEVDAMPLAAEEIKESRERDRDAKNARLSARDYRAAEYQREYYERNKDAIVEYQRDYRERNKDAIAERRRNRVDKNRNDNDVIRLGQRLRHIRKMCGLSQANLARITGLSQGSISNYETGATPMTDALIIWITQKERELYGRDP